MSHLSKLKIVAQQQKRLQSKTEHRRAKLLEKLDDQLGMVGSIGDLPDPCQVVHPYLAIRPPYHIARPEIL